MTDAYFPLKYLLAMAALWLSRQQQYIIDFLKEENRLLKASWAIANCTFPMPSAAVWRHALKRLAEKRYRSSILWLRPIPY